MSRSGALAFHNELRRLNTHLLGDFLPRLTADYEVASGLPAGSLSMRGKELVNEAQVRRYILDPVLNCLGWDVNTPTRALVEAPAESNEAGAHRRFLDYFGRSTDESASASLLIVEAKRLSLDIPSHDPGISSKDAVLAALRTYRNSISDVSVEWKKIFDAATDYVNRLIDASSAGPPKRFMLTNGSWYIVFLNPVRTLANQVIDQGDILVAKDTDDACSMAQELYENLSYEALCEVVPRQSCTDLLRFIKTTGNPLSVSLAVEVSTGDVGVKPMMSMTVVANVLVPSGSWVRFGQNPDTEDPVYLIKEAEMPAHMAELKRRADALLTSLEGQHPIAVVDAANYESTRGARVPTFPATVLLSKDGMNRYVLHLGNSAEPLLQSTDFDSCPFHAHANSHAAGLAIPETPILRPSSTPSAYFPNGSVYHCSHRTVHSIREDRCPIRALEDFLCCRKCSLQTRCWPTGFDSFPCQANTENT